MQPPAERKGKMWQKFDLKKCVVKDKLGLKINVFKVLEDVSVSSTHAVGY